MTPKDTGGIVALRGFNFQKSIAAYLLITNLKDKSFVLTMERKEDIEVESKGKQFYIQVKSNQIGARDAKIKKEKHSKDKTVLTKLIENASSTSYNKLVCKSYTTGVELMAPESSIIFADNDSKYKFKEEVVDKHARTKDILDKLSRTYLVPITKITKESKDNTNYIVGCLSDFLSIENIQMTNDRIREIVNSIKKLIEDSSTRGIETDRELESKKISSLRVIQLIEINKDSQDNKEHFKRLLDSLNLNPIEKIQIMAFYTSTANIETIYNYTSVQSVLMEKNSFKNFTEFNDELFHSAVYNLKNIRIDDYHLKAIIIDIVVKEVLYGKQ